MPGALRRWIPGLRLGKPRAPRAVAELEVAEHQVGREVPGQAGKSFGDAARYTATQLFVVLSERFDDALKDEILVPLDRLPVPVLGTHSGLCSYLDVRTVVADLE